jgi:hypothetical protein
MFTEFFEIRLAFNRLGHGMTCGLIYVVRHGCKDKNMRIVSRGKVESNIEDCKPRTPSHDCSTGMTKVSDYLEHRLYPYIHTHNTPIHEIYHQSSHYYKNKRILFAHNKVFVVNVGGCPYIYNAVENNKGFRCQGGATNANHFAKFPTHHIIIGVTVVKQ